MSAYKYIKQTLQKEVTTKSPEYKARLIKMRKESTITRLEKPTNVARARSLGYKAKQGFVVVRVRVKKGHGLIRRPRRGRRPKRMGVNKITRGKSKQLIAEERAGRKFPNTEIMNSYWICEDGSNKWFEVILVDVHHPAIKNDKDVSWIKSQKGRAHRGLTSAGRKTRGLNKKGKGTEKTRPGIRANKRRGK